MKNQKSLTNKGFSLVELIIVVAIMAILIGVLAPQYLRYVEKTRLQKDNTAMGEIANVMKMASAEEDVINAIPAGGVDLEFDNTNNYAFKGSNGGTGTIDEELAKTLGAFSDIRLTSKTYTGGTLPVLKVTVDSNKVVTVKATGWYDAPGTAHTGDKTF